ncbi:MAG: hypothetical protein ACREUN_04010 [Burkholderiales bacterium]
MGHACAHEDFQEPPPPPNGEHPIIAVLAVLAIIAAILLITWARFEVHGSDDIQAALDEEAPSVQKPAEERQLDEHVTANRFATGLSP